MLVTGVHVTLQLSKVLDSVCLLYVILVVYSVWVWVWVFDCLKNCHTTYDIRRRKNTILPVITKVAIHISNLWSVEAVDLDLEHLEKR